MIFQMSWMTKEIFGRLCNKNTWIHVKSENYLSLPDSARRVEEALNYFWGFVPGEVKVTMTLCMLTGTSYLDLLWAHEDITCRIL